MIAELSLYLKRLQKYTPEDFVRKLGSLHFVIEWKATQFRQFLLYQGLLVLKKKVPEKVYDMFMYLSLGIRILSSTDTELYSKGNKFIKKFIKLFIEIYGVEYCNHNIHGLSHIYVDVLNHGPLDKFSAFRFENFMQKIKKDIRKPENVLSQIFNRIGEREGIEVQDKKNIDYNRFRKDDGILPKDCISPQYTKFVFNNFKINTENLADNCFLTKTKKVIRIENVATTKLGEIVLIGRKFVRKQEYFKKYMDSSDLDIYEVKELSPIELFHLDDIEKKMFLMNIKQNSFLVIPLIHS